MGGPKVTRSGLYGRNSKPPKGWRPTSDGEEPPGSWSVQIAKTRAFAVACGDEVVIEEHDVATGSDPNRPAWARLMNAVRGHIVQRVYCTKMDRPMRDLRHFLDVAQDFERAGAELVFIDQQGASVRKGDAAGKAFRNTLAVFAEFELDLTRERSAAVFELGDDGRLYGPRSKNPAGRPVEYGPEHKFRTRADGSREHVRARCRVCRGVGNQGGQVPEGEGAENGGVGYPVGFPTRVKELDSMESDAEKLPDEMHVDGRGETTRGNGILPSGGGAI